MNSSIKNIAIVDKYLGKSYVAVNHIVCLTPVLDKNEKVYIRVDTFAKVLVTYDEESINKLAALFNIDLNNLELDKF